MRRTPTDGPRPARTGVRAAVLVATLLLIAALVLAAGCGGDAGDAFVGEWSSEAMGNAIVTVTREGDEFTIALPNRTYEGKLDDDAVFAPFDDPVIVLETKGDDLIMHFYKEENALLLKRVE